MWEKKLWNKMAEFLQDGGQQQIVETFQRVGLLNAFDGSEDHLVQVQGAKDYSFDSDSDEDSESNIEEESSGESDVESGGESDEKESGGEESDGEKSDV